MSAVRRNDNRSVNRSRQSLPYARPASKKSQWSITGLLSFLNPMRSRLPVADAQPQPSPHSESEESSDTPTDEDTAPAQKLSAREHDLADDLNVFGQPNAIAGSSTHLPQQIPSTFADPVTPTHTDPHYTLYETSSPSKNLETVATFLNQRRGQPISEIEVEGLVSLIQKSTPPDKHEPFRFSSSTPSTPARGNTPVSNQNTNLNINFGFNTPSPTANQTPASSARKTLSKNPNGVYRWEGGGSAKPLRTRNRYHSPVFGPPRSTPERIVLKAPPGEGEGKADTKRRRVGEDAGNSSATASGIVNGNGNVIGSQPRSGAPAPSPTRITQAFPFPVSSPSPRTPPPAVNGTTTISNINGVSSLTPTSRSRTTGLPQKPTVPAVPSPLRQAWGRSPSSSQADIPESTPSGQAQNGQHRQTKAANFMSELIKEVTPPKRPDVSNPYQTASPVGKVGAAKGRAKRVRATGKPAPPKSANDNEKTEEEKQDVQKAKKGNEKEYSPQAIIEATLPKGSKRSRPPAHFDQPSSASAPVTSSTPSPRHSPRDRRHELPVGHHAKGDLQVDINENEDEDRPVTKKSKPSVNGNGYRSVPENGVTNKATGRRTPDVVIEEVDDVDMSPEVPTVNRSVDQPAKVTPVIVPTSTNANGNGFSSSTSSGGISPTSTTGRPLFGSLKSSSAPKEPSKLRFSYQPEVGSSSPTPTPASHGPMMDAREGEEQKVLEGMKLKRKRVDPKDAAIAMAVDALPTYVFTVTGNSGLSTAAYSNARNKATSLPISSLPSFDFSIQAREKNTAKSSDKMEPAVPVAPVKAFDWAAAGMKAPTSAGGGGASWTCSTCMLSNPSSAVDKCTVCESPR